MTMHSYRTTPRDPGVLLEFLNGAVDRSPAHDVPSIPQLSLSSGRLLSAAAIADRALLDPDLDPAVLEDLADAAARTLSLTTRAIDELEDDGTLRGDETVAQAITLAQLTLASPDQHPADAVHFALSAALGAAQLYAGPEPRTLEGMLASLLADQLIVFVKAQGTATTLSH